MEKKKKNKNKKWINSKYLRRNEYRKNAVFFVDDNANESKFVKFF